MKTRFFLLILSFFVISCGATTSISKIMKASEARDHAFKMIVASYGLTDKISVDRYGYKTFDKSIVASIKPIEQREALYYYFLGEALLQDARELQSGALYERSEMLADESLENSKKAIKTASSFLNRNRKVTKTVKQIEKRLINNKPLEPQPAVKPQPVVKPQPAVKPQPVVKPKPSVKPQPVVKPQPAVKPQPEGKPQPTVLDFSSRQKPVVTNNKKSVESKKVEKKKKKTGYADMYEKLRKEAKEKKKESGTKDEKTSGGAK
jgi:hypothetical protein